MIKVIILNLIKKELIILVYLKMKIGLGKMMKDIIKQNYIKIHFLVMKHLI